jgi:long-chain acyl-CoA synthetase
MAEATVDPVQTGIPTGTGPITADLGTIVPRAARRFGSKTALVAPGRTLTYAKLDELCDRVAGGLHDIGIRPGDRVSLYSPNRWEYVVAYHAALRAAAVVNPINVMLTPEEVAFVLNDCGAAAIFTSGDRAEVISGLTRSVPTLRRVISFDSASGGVTGFGDLLAGPAAAPQVPRPTPADLSTIGYTSGTTGHPKGAMQSHRAVFLNTAAVFAVHTRTDRDVMLNALPLPHVYGNVIMNGTFMVGATLVMLERFEPAAIGDPGVTVPDGEPGELMIRGPLVMLGYYGNEAATRATIEPDGWMHTVPPPPRRRSSSTAARTWPPTSCPARSGSSPTCPRPRLAR